MKNIYKCIVSKNEKRYYKSVGGKWKRISNKMGEKMEKNKKKYRVEEKTGDKKLEDLPEELIRKIAGLSDEHKALLASSSGKLNRVTQPLLNLDRKNDIADNIKIEEEYIETLQRQMEDANDASHDHGGAGYMDLWNAPEDIEMAHTDIENLRNELETIEERIEEDIKRDVRK